MRHALLFLFLLAGFTSIAQKQNNNWCFGWFGGLDFNTNPPSVFVSKVHTNEGVATVSDRRTGDLLFYASTNTVYNRNHVMMIDGDFISDDGVGTSAQGVCIVPFVNDTNQYYVFAISGWYNSGRLEYSVVDISVVGGLGAVIANRKNIVIDSIFTEAITVVPGCKSYWLLVKKRISGNIYAYKITKDGVDTKNPVITNIPYAYTNKHVETMKVSPDGKRLVIGSWNGKPSSFLALHDFDVATGLAHNGRVIDVGGGGFYGIEFSPNSKVLYAAGWTGQNVYQYDLTQPTAADIKASRKTLHTVSNNIGMIQIGPDSNLYVSIDQQKGLDRITNPNALYPGCTYTPNAIPLPSVATATMGLPQAIVYPVGYDPRPDKKDTLICFHEPVVLKGRKGKLAYKWQDGSIGDSLLVAKPGKYWVTYSEMCPLSTDTTFTTDTTIVKEVKLTASIVNSDTVICKGDTILLEANVLPNNAAISWTTGETTLSTKVADEGIYVLRANYTGCDVKDEVNVTHHIKTRLGLGEDREICADESIMLPELITSNIDDAYLWQDGSKGRTFKVNKAGVYHVQVSNSCETISDTVKITTRNCRLFFPNAFTPNGDGRNDVPLLKGDIANVTDYEIHIYHRWGEEVFASQDIQQGWDGKLNGKEMGQDVYYYFIKYKYHGEEQIWKGNLLLVR